MARTVSQTINLQTPDQVRKYITDISSRNGIQIHAINNVGSNYTQIDSNGLTVYNGGIDVALFGVNGVRLGQEGKSHLAMDFHSLQLIDKENNSYLYISDLRNTQGLISITDNFEGNNHTVRFSLSYDNVDVDSIVLEGTDNEFEYRESSHSILFTTAPQGAFTVTYNTSSDKVKAFTFGQRDSTYNIGGCSSAFGLNVAASKLGAFAEGEESKALARASHAEGYQTTATGVASHVEGASSSAQGYASHAEGTSTAIGWYSHTEGGWSQAEGDYSHAGGYWTIAGEENQTVIGKYNDNQSDTAFEIGNGTSNSARSNALTVDWNGKIKCGDNAGNFKSIFDIFYPVGSYYETSDSTFDPNIVWGGTWELESGGRVHISSGANEANTTDFWGSYPAGTNTFPLGEMGGESMHTLTINEMPSHAHYDGTSDSIAYGPPSGTSTAAVMFNANWGRPTTYTGGGSWHNNMPPYVVINRWHRTA